MWHMKKIFFIHSHKTSMLHHKGIWEILSYKNFIKSLCNVKGDIELNYSKKSVLFKPTNKGGLSTVAVPGGWRGS